MAVAKDAVSEATAGTGNLSWTHTPSGTPKGVVVYVIQRLESADQVSSVTYGGTAMTEVTGSPNSKATGEATSVSAFFLGSSVPTGAQTVSVTVSGASDKKAYAVTMTAAADTEVQATDVSINTDAGGTNVRGTVSLSGNSCFVSQGFFTGVGDVSAFGPISGGNWTGDFEYDFGAQCAAMYTYDTVGTSDVTTGWDASGTDDAVCIAVAVKESGGGGISIPVVMHHRMLMGMS